MSEEKLKMYKPMQWEKCAFPVKVILPEVYGRKIKQLVSIRFS